MLKIIIFVASIGFHLFEVNAIEDFIRQYSYTASTDVLKRLLETEEILEENLANYAAVLKRKLDLTQHALNDLEAEANRMSSDMETYLNNPLNSFALIRHQQQDWQKWASFMDEMHGEEIVTFAHEIRSRLPTALDLQEASRSIEVLITYYELDTSELANGTFLGYSQPQAALSSLDCYAMGMYNYFQKDYHKAEIWFNTSLARYDKRQDDIYKVNNFSIHRIHKWLGVLLIKRNENNTAMRHIKQVERNGFDDILNEQTALTTTMEHCAASLHRPSNLHCRYNYLTTPFLRIAPLKLEELSMDPFMVLYHDVIYDSEIEWLISESLKWKPARLAQDEISSIRTAKDVFLDRTGDNVTETIHKRLTDMSGFNMEGSNDLSLINYGIGGHYDEHYDAFNEESPYGNRIATALFYLSDVELGGATTFSKLNLTIAPKKGTAILWHNLQDDGTIHLKTLHAACPVIVGSKYVMTKWIFNLNQLFIKPCQPII